MKLYCPECKKIWTTLVDASDCGTTPEFRLCPPHLKLQGKIYTSVEFNESRDIPQEVQ